MNARQSNKLAMYREVRAFLNTTTATHALTALPAKIATLITLLTRIDDLLKIQETPLDGVLDTRDQATNAVIDLALAVAGPVQSYAVSKNRPELTALVNLSRSDFAMIRRGERWRLAQRVLDAATPLATDLVAFGVTAKMLEDLQAKIDANKLTVDGPRTTVADKKTATGSLADTFKDIDLLLNDEIDPLMAVLSETDPDALARYQVARDVMNRPGVHSTGGVPVPPIDGTPVAPAAVKLAA